MPPVHPVPVPPRPVNEVQDTSIHNKVCKFSLQRNCKHFKENLCFLFVKFVTFVKFVKFGVPPGTKAALEAGAL